MKSYKADVLGCSSGPSKVIAEQAGGQMRVDRRNKSRDVTDECDAHTIGPRGCLGVCSLAATVLHLSTFGRPGLARG